MPNYCNYDIKKVCEKENFNLEKHENSFKVRLEEIGFELWKIFSDIPVDPETECIDIAFLSFPKGTHREEIWHWFEETFNVKVYDLLYSDFI